MSNAPRDTRGRRNWGEDDSSTPILHVDMDSFFAQVELLENPELLGKPLIVGGVNMRSVVTSATYEARARGVRAGMPMMRAKALCPQAWVVQGQHSVYSAYSQRVMRLLKEITPVFEQVSIDEAFLDVSGARRRLGSPVSIAQLIRQRIRTEVGLPASVGIAATKSVAKVASSNAKPDGYLLIPREATTTFLHGLQVGALWGVGNKTEMVLRREGIDTIGDLAQTPVDRLARLLGVALAHHLHALAWGIDPRPVASASAEKSIGTEVTFEQDVYARAEIERLILSASHKCARRLREAHMVAWTVSIKIRDGSFHTRTRSLTLAAPTDVGRDIAAAAKKLFTRETMPSVGIRLFGVRTEGLQPRSEGVAVTLDNDERPLRAERVMDRVSSKYGKTALIPASLLPDGDEIPPTF